MMRSNVAVRAYIRNLGRSGVIAGIAVATAVAGLVVSGAGPAAAAVRKAATTTTIAASASPQFGQAVTVTATVRPLTATGSVTFRAAVGRVKVSLPASCAAVPLVAGQASCTFVPAHVAKYRFRARYSGSATLRASAGKIAFAVTRATTSTTVSISSPVDAGGAATATATVSPDPSGGTVTFTAAAGGSPVALPPSCAGIALSGGQAACTFTAASAGSYSITATYSGTADDLGSAGTGTFTARSASMTVISFSANPAAGQPVTATATTTPAPAGGTVAFSATLNGAAYQLPAACTAITPVAGNATCTFTPSAADTYAVTASFSGDSGDAASSATSSVVVTAPIATSVAVSDNAAAVIQGQPIVFTAAVSAADGSIPPGGVTWSVTPNTAFADSSCASTSYNSGTGIATCTVNTYLDPTGGYDGNGHDWMPGSVNASATFTPAGAGYAGSSGSDSTLKITSASISQPCGSVTNCSVAVTPGTTAQATQSETGLPASQVSYFWGCQTTSGDCSWVLSANPASPTVSFVVTADLTATSYVCAAGDTPVGSFTCLQGSTTMSVIVVGGSGPILGG